MLQFIWKIEDARRLFINRSTQVRLAELIDIDQLREQLEQRASCATNRN